MARHIRCTQLYEVCVCAKEHQDSKKIQSNLNRKKASYHTAACAISRIAGLIQKGIQIIR